jgi:hypothetical protein
MGQLVPLYATEDSKGYTTTTTITPTTRTTTTTPPPRRPPAAASCQLAAPRLPPRRRRRRDPVLTGGGQRRDQPRRVPPPLPPLRTAAVWARAPGVKRPPQATELRQRRERRGPPPRAAGLDAGLRSRLDLPAGLDRRLTPAPAGSGWRTAPPPAPLSCRQPTAAAVRTRRRWRLMHGEGGRGRRRPRLGLYTLTHSLQAPGFKSSNLKCDILGFKICFPNATCTATPRRRSGRPGRVPRAPACGPPPRRLPSTLTPRRPEQPVRARTHKRQPGQRNPLPAPAPAPAAMAALLRIWEEGGSIPRRLSWRGRCARRRRRQPRGAGTGLALAFARRPPLGARVSPTITTASAAAAAAAAALVTTECIRGDQSARLSPPPARVRVTPPSITLPYTLPAAAAAGAGASPRRRHGLAARGRDTAPRARWGRWGVRFLTSRPTDPRRTGPAPQGARETPGRPRRRPPWTAQQVMDMPPPGEREEALGPGRGEIITTAGEVITTSTSRPTTKTAVATGLEEATAVTPRACPRLR